MQNKTVILVVGHNEKSRGAANNTFGETEYSYNQDLAKRITRNVNTYLPSLKLTTIDGNLSNRAKHGIINEIARKEDVALTIDLHLNSSSNAANYFLIKHARRSVKGALASKILSNNLTQGTAFTSPMTTMQYTPAMWADMSTPGCFKTDRRPPVKDRDKSYFRDSWKYAGSEFLFNTIPPAILIEPFFISNNEIMSKMVWDSGREELSLIIADAIINFIFSED